MSLKIASLLLSVLSVHVLANGPQHDPFLENDFINAPLTKEDDAATTLKNVVAQAKEGEKIILIFTASWCGPCQEQKPSVKKMHEKMKAQKSGHLFFIDLNDKKNKPLIDHLKISSIPTSYIFVKQKGQLKQVAYLEGKKNWQSDEIEKIVFSKI